MRALIVEDVETDAELLCLTLRDKGYDLNAKIVSTEPDFIAALEGGPDVIFADY